MNFNRFMRILPVFAVAALGAVQLCAQPAQPLEHEHHAPSTNSVVNPHGAENQGLQETLANQPPQPSGLYPQKGWPNPVMDDARHFFFLADILELQPAGDDSQARWDLESYYGGDFNRVWFKSEGEKSVSNDAYNFDAQLLYGRFFGKYYDFQIGIRTDATDFSGRDRTRGHAVIGIEGLAPYRFQIETLLFISQDGDVSARFTASRDFLMTQRLVLQGRLETALAIQEVKEFGVGSGVNNVELGVRLRYEIWREFAPYIGVSWSRSLSETEDLIRAKGDDPNDLRFVAGVRLWF